MVYTYHTSTGEAELRGSGVQGQPGVHINKILAQHTSLPKVVILHNPVSSPPGTDKVPHYRENCDQFRLQLPLRKHTYELLLAALEFRAT